MGAEADCTLSYQGKTARGKALLETDELVFRGAIRLAIPYKTLTGVEAINGKLKIQSPAGTAVFSLGDLAEKWAQKILNPKSLLDRLGVKSDSQVTILGVEDDSFGAQLRERTSAVTTAGLKSDQDLIFLAMDAKGDLKKLGRLQGCLKKNGAIWVIWPKGKSALKEDDVRAAAKEVGLVDVKVAKFSETHSALKLIIPLARR